MASTTEQSHLELEFAVLCVNGWASMQVEWVACVGADLDIAIARQGTHDASFSDVRRKPADGDKAGGALHDGESESS